MEIFVCSPRGIMLCVFPEKDVQLFIEDNPEAIYFFAEIVPA